MKKILFTLALLISFSSYGQENIVNASKTPMTLKEFTFKLFEEEIVEEKFCQLKEGDGNFDDPDGKDKLVIGWRPVLEELGYNFPKEEWVKYDPSTEAFYDLPDTLAMDYYKKWAQAAEQVLPETDFNCTFWSEEELEFFYKEFYLKNYMRPDYEFWMISGEIQNWVKVQIDKDDGF